MSECKWKASGRLKPPRKPLDLSFWRLILLVNWSSDWTWGTVLKSNDLRLTILGFHKTERMTDSGEILTCWSFIFFKLAIAFGWSKR